MSFHCTNSCSVPNTLCTITSHSISIPSLKLKCNTNNNRFKIHAKSNSDDAPQQPTSTPSSFLSFLCPLLNLFSGGDPSGQRNFALELATSSLASTSRFAWGRKSVIESASSEKIASEPPISLQLFEFEACPFCRRVREAMTELDLSVEVSRRFITYTTFNIYCSFEFPFLIDQNSGVSMYESSDIVKYLFERYGEGRSPSLGLLESTIFTGWMPTIIRAGRGMTLWERSRVEPPPTKLELFSYENNPDARIVREALCELELPYILQNVGEGSRRMKLLFDASGSKEVPYFVDHNTGFQSGDYKMILPYLFETYSSANL
ncbi:uncharacterized protein [Medicago truncatula]|uniref:uncharacterized protein isoform X2 n=1 Tax=Medicago truncatula TaxID=3880 RepID=UPI0019684FF9|nr:uncharacterized protein LOC11419395 isoform X2 [Medicago truncatula]